MKWLILFLTIFAGSQAYADVSSPSKINEDDVNKFTQLFDKGIESNFAFTDDRKKTGYGQFLYYPGHFKLDYKEPDGIILEGDEKNINLVNIPKKTNKQIDVMTNPMAILTQMKKENLVIMDTRDGKNSFQIDIASKEYPERGLMSIIIADLGGDIRLYSMKIRTLDNNWTDIDFNGCKSLSVEDVKNKF